MNENPVVKVTGLCKTFGSVKAVQDVSFEIDRGQVVGFIGANGAGKTTTMRMMATLDCPDQGIIEICGYDVMQYPGRVRGIIGWMPDAYGAYTGMTVWEYLDFFARAYGYRGAERARRIDDVMMFADLAPIAESAVNKLSKGMSQRLCLGRTLLPDPEALILDEPAAGLDPRARIDFKRLVRLLSDNGKTIFISSHILSELEEMCDSLVFIDNGKIVHQGSSDSLKRREGMPVLIRIETNGAPDTLASWVELRPGIAIYDTDQRGARIRLETGDPEHIAGLLRAMIGDGLPVTDFHRESIRLEDAFVDILSKVGGAN